MLFVSHSHCKRIASKATKWTTNVKVKRENVNKKKQLDENYEMENARDASPPTALVKYLSISEYKIFTFIQSKWCTCKTLGNTEFVYNATHKKNCSCFMSSLWVCVCVCSVLCYFLYYNEFSLSSYFKQFQFHRRCITA